MKENGKGGNKMKRYFMEYESDKMICGSYRRVYGFSNSIRTCKNYISRVKKECAEDNPRKFKIYDTLGECKENEHVPCVYEEK